MNALEGFNTEYSEWEAVNRRLDNEYRALPVIDWKRYASIESAHGDLERIEKSFASECFRIAKDSPWWLLNAEWKIHGS